MPDSVAQSVDRRVHGQKVGSSNSSRVQQIPYQIDTCDYLAWYSALIGWGKDCLAQHQKSVTVRDIMSWCWHSGHPGGQHYKVAISVHCQKVGPPRDMSLDVARTQNNNKHK